MAAAADTRRLCCFFDNGEGGAEFASVGRGAADDTHFAVGHVVFASAALSGAVSLVLGFFHYTFCRRALCGAGVDSVDEGFAGGASSFLALFPIGGFICFGYAADEPDEAVAVAFRGYGRYLGFGIC